MCARWGELLCVKNYFFSIEEKEAFAKRANNNTRRAQSPSIEEEEDYDDDELVDSIQLPIEEVDEAVNKENEVNEQLSTEHNTTIEPTRPPRARRLPMRYR